jgi:hypothetical protein
MPRREMPAPVSANTPHTTDREADRTAPLNGVNEHAGGRERPVLPAPAQPAKGRSGREVIDLPGSPEDASEFSR